MIVTCPSCTARYKIDAAKLTGRGARITCPKCSHKFVLERSEPPPGAPVPPADLPAGPPSDLARRDFRQHGITWRVRKGIGLTYDFHDLALLREYMSEGHVDGNDVISYDAREWVPLRTIPDLAAFFWDVWRRAEAGEIGPAAAPVESDEEDESDAPTTIIGHGSALSDEIRKAVMEGTPVPVSDKPAGVGLSVPSSTLRIPSAAAPPPSPPAGKSATPPAPAKSAATATDNTKLALPVVIAVVTAVVFILWFTGVFNR